MIVSSRSIRLIPVIWPVLVCITIITPYIIAVSLGHVYPFLPSISKAASFEPQASLFGALMTLVAFLGLAMMVARYVQVQAVPGDLECEFSTVWHFVSHRSCPGRQCQVFCRSGMYYGR